MTKRTLVFGIVILLGGISVVPGYAKAAGPSTAAKPPGDLSQRELETLVQPIALYPDLLLQQVLAACTFPEQLLDAALYHEQGRPPEGIRSQPWDDSVKGVANYPSVLRGLAQDLDWTISLGSVFINQNEALRRAIQTMRARAKSVGNLKESEQQHVIQEKTPTGDTIIRIEPAEPEVVYVPTTTTSVVYEEPVESSNLWAPVATFGLGMVLGYAMGDDDDDHHYYGGGYYGPGFWHSNEAADRWMDYREDRWDDAYDFANDRQKWRQDNREDWREYRQDLGTKQQEWRSEARSRAGELTPEQRAQASARANERRAARSTTGSGGGERARNTSTQRSQGEAPGRGTFSKSGSANYGSFDREQAQQRMQQARANPQLQQRSREVSASSQERLNQERSRPQFQQRASQYDRSYQPRERNGQARSQFSGSSMNRGGGLSGVGSGGHSVSRSSARGSASLARGGGGFSRGSGGGRGRR